MSVVLIPCPACGQDAHRRSIYRFNLGSGMPTRYRVSEAREAAAEANYYHERMERSRGKPIPRRDLFKEAKMKAIDHGAKVK